MTAASASSGDIIATASLCVGDSNLSELWFFFLNHVFQPATEKHSSKNIKKAKHFDYVSNFGEIIAHHLFTKNL